MIKRGSIKKVAIEMVKESGLINLSRLALCERAGIPDGSFLHVMGCTFSDFITELKNKKIPLPTLVHPKVIRTRADPELREDQILSVATMLARQHGCHKLTRDDIALKAGVSMGLVTKYFQTMKQLKRKVMRIAIKQNIVEIIAHGILNKDKYIRKAPILLKIRAQRLIDSKSR